MADQENPETHEWWCRWCGKPVLLVGYEDTPVEFRRAVHAGTGQERSGMDRHVAAPQDHEPPVWRSARILTAEFGGLFAVEGRYGFLRADWADRVTPVHYEAHGPGAEEEMRRQLRVACVRAGIDPPALAGAAGAAL